MTNGPPPQPSSSTFFTGSQVERFHNRGASDDQIVALCKRALYPAHLVIEHDVRHGCLVIPVLPLRLR
jgi:hypothetical protein